MSMIQGLLTELKITRKFFLHSISVLHEEHSNFSPQAPLFTVAQHVEHVAQTVEWFLDGAFHRPDGFNKDWPAMDAEVHAQHSLTAGLERLNRAFNRAESEIAAMDEATLCSPMGDPEIMAESPKMAIISAIVDHTAHHRGALTVYARLLGRRPPMPYE